MTSDGEIGDSLSAVATGVLESSSRPNGDMDRLATSDGGRTRGFRRNVAGGDSEFIGRRNQSASGHETQKIHSRSNPSVITFL
jgi:hypothetical protein